MRAKPSLDWLLVLASLLVVIMAVSFFFVEHL